jgi:ribosome biogenesis GTPase A
MVVGIPNVGKSTLINSLTGRRVAKVGDRPAITRHAQRVELDRDLSIFDSPGVLWPKLDDQEGAYRLAASGAVGEAAFDLVDVACWAVRFVAERYAGACRPLRRRELPILARPRRSRDSSRAVALSRLSGRRGAAPGGRVDLERAADLFLRDLRAGKLGGISFEHPDDHARYLEDLRKPGSALRVEDEASSSCSAE